MLELVWKSRGGKYSYIHPHTLEITEEVSGNVQLKESGDNSQVLWKRGEKASVHQTKSRKKSQLVQSNSGNPCTSCLHGDNIGLAIKVPVTDIQNMGKHNTEEENTEKQCRKLSA